ncbi:hypothetical protein B566_EDAN002664 [Ephemera danica]|nr:hypothetical protein B566_EDAN002664 [Ephemera danica]
MNRNSELRKLPAKSTVELANILEEMQAWKVLMSAIKRDDNSSKYSLTQINGRQRPTLGTLLALLVDCELFRAADYLAINILGEPPVRRPRSTPSPPPESDIPDAIEDTSPQLVPYIDLESACHWHDDDAKLLGSGAFGSVFLGHLPQLNHKAVAVKKLQTDVTSNDKQYRHANLVQLLGYSCDGPCYCLVYEFMSNGSLQDRLACLDSPFVENPTSEPLKYELRLHIAHDVARGLVYLHTAGESPLIHRDVKSANILLGTNFTAKLGDFGLVRLSGDHNPNNSGSVSGTAGTSAYMAPEALQSGEITVLCDTFSYGVVLMEILTSLAPIDETRECWDLVSIV